MISQINSDDLIINEKKSYLFSLFLKCNLNDYESHRLSLFNVILHNLQLKNDSFKCNAIKGLINASEWSNDDLFDFLKSNSIFSYLCNLLKIYNSLKLTRYILTLFLKLITKNNNYLIQLIDSDLQSAIIFVIKENEDRCSALCIDIYQHIIMDNIANEKNIDLSFLLDFQNKGFIAKTKLVEFLAWIYKNKFDVFFVFDDSEIKQLFYIVDDIAQSENKEVYSNINDLYLSIEETEYGVFLLSLLANNEDFRIFLHDSENKPEYLYIEQKINDLLASSQ